MPEGQIEHLIDGLKIGTTRGLIKIYSNAPDLNSLTEYHNVGVIECEQHEIGSIMHRIQEDMLKYPLVMITEGHWLATSQIKSVHIELQMWVPCLGPNSKIDWNDGEWVADTDNSHYWINSKEFNESYLMYLLKAKQ